MSISKEGIFKRIYTVLIEDDKDLDNLGDVDVMVYSLIFLRAGAKKALGRFGPYTKPDEAAAQMGLFLSDGRMKEKLKSVGLSSSSHEWKYGACVSYWHQMGRVAREMAAEERARTVDGLSGLEVKMALSAWVRIFIELTAQVQGYRMAFMRMAVDSSMSSSRAALAEVELAAQVNVGELKDVRNSTGV